MSKKNRKNELSLMDKEIMNESLTEQEVINEAEPVLELAEPVTEEVSNEELIPEVEEIAAPVVVEKTVVTTSPISLKSVQDYVQKVYELKNDTVTDCIKSLIEYTKAMNGKMSINDLSGAQKQEDLLASFKKLVIYTKEEFKFVFSVFLMIIEDDLTKYKQDSCFSDSKKLRFLDKTKFDSITKNAFKFLMNFLSDASIVKDRATVNVRINFEQLKPLFTKNVSAETAEQLKNKLKNFFS